MPSTRLLVRQTALRILADPSVGFNAHLAAIAASYGIAHPFAINWTPGSQNFFQGYVAPDHIEQTDLLPAGDGVSVAMYTSQSQTNAGDERQKPSTFSGKILLHVDFYFRRSTLNLLRQGAKLPGDDGGDLDSLPDAVEDAFLQTVMAPHAGWSPVSFNGDFSCAREPFAFLGDGWQQRLPFILLTEVHL
jgi:hypothetical protein